MNIAVSHMDTIHERFSLMLRELGLTAYQLAQDVGENPSKLYNIMNGKAKPSFSTIEVILNKYPQVNGHWLLTGEGEKLVQHESNATLVPALEEPYVDLPFIPVTFYMSFTEGYADDCEYTHLETYRVYDPGAKAYKNGVVIEVQGNSMRPQLAHGSKVLAVCVDRGDWQYQSGGVYALMYRDYFVVKRIKDNELMTKGMLTLHSDNPDSGSMPVKVEDIRGMWKVLRVVDSPVE